MWVLPSVREFGNRETRPATGMEFRLKRAGVRYPVDVLFLDVPAWAGGKIVGFAPARHPQGAHPGAPSNDSWSGVTEALKTISHFTTPGGPNEELDVTGIVRSVGPRDSEFRQIHQDRRDRLTEGFGDLILPTVVKSYAVREGCRTTYAPSPRHRGLRAYCRPSRPSSAPPPAFTTPPSSSVGASAASPTEALIPDPARFVPACASRPAPGLRDKSGDAGTRRLPVDRVHLARASSARPAQRPYGRA
ncbi:hypothetical protein [Streptomyces sp. NPDC001312]|uniref:hypothetical protein n=1 Tax=Streptomyces sp. NPDC001312 TaxID=3364561 RepID=UPI0036D1467B